MNKIVVAYSWLGGCNSDNQPSNPNFYACSIYTNMPDTDGSKVMEYICELTDKKRISFGGVSYDNDSANTYGIYEEKANLMIRRVYTTFEQFVSDQNQYIVASLVVSNQF